MPENLRHLIQQRLSSHGLALLRQATEVAAGLRYPLVLVGGTVRDLLLNTPTLDLDLAVEGDGLNMAGALAASLGGRVSARSQFGTARVRAGDYTIDVATARRERYPEPGALPVVTPGPLEEDLARRDFTINAMAIDLSPDRWGELVDLYGGRADLDARRLRVLHHDSFRDDPTRMVRALRYACRLGFRLEAQTEFLLRRDAPYLGRISGARRGKELLRLLEEPQPEGALLLGQSLELLPQLHHTLHTDRWTAETMALARQDPPARAQLPTVCLCVLLFRVPAAHRQESIADLQLPAARARTLRDLATIQERLPEMEEPALLPSQAVALLDGLSLPALHACSVATDAPILQERLRRYLACWRKVQSLLSGDDLARMGLPVGPAIGRCLAFLREAQLDGRCNDREEEEALVRSWLAASQGP
ncbi:MAG: CCA tRNA nucleotidyltransferase [Chloroflexi bacterium]|nr:CCA tRNA nucleotidyltransferase [Chloroflexota bacterium]